jgi:hypothetical protein
MLDNEGTRFLDDMTVEEFTADLPTRAVFVRNAQETIEVLRSLAGLGESRKRQPLPLKLEMFQSLTGSE